MPPDVAPIMAGLLFTLAAGGFATALLTARRDTAGQMRASRVAILATAYAGLGVAALAALWRLWGEGLGSVADPQPATVQRYLAIFTLLLLGVLVAAVAGTDAGRTGARWLRRHRRSADVEQMQREVAQLTAATAHDLKSPLRTIYASAALLERRMEPRGMDKEVLGHIKDSARRMTTMVDELLRYTKVANSAPDVQEVRFLRVAQAVEADLQEVIDGRMATVEWRGGGTLHADPVLIERALSNLVENAIKYGPEAGHVVVRAEPFLGGLRITVEDQGPGVPEDERERIFDVFQRGSAALDVAGTGLGLATVAKVAQLHSGSVGVESAEGAGSRFWLWIPGASDPMRRPIHTAEPIVGSLPVIG